MISIVWNSQLINSIEYYSYLMKSISHECHYQNQLIDLHSDLIQDPFPIFHKYHQVLMILDHPNNQSVFFVNHLDKILTRVVY